MNFEQVVEKLFAAIQQKDVDQVLSLISVDEDIYQVLLNGAVIKGRAAFLNLQIAWLADEDWHLDYTILRAIETAEMAYALLLLEYNDPKMTDPSYQKPQYVSLVFTKKDDKWVLCHDQTTVVQ